MESCMRVSIRIPTLAFATLAFIAGTAQAADAPATLVRHAGVKQALERIKADDALTLREQIEIAETPAPPFKESVRAQDYLRRLQALGLTDASIDSEGNVIGVRKGTQRSPVLVVSAHLDTVFPEGDDVKVTQKDGRYYGRGLVDDSRGLTTLLAMLRAMEAAKIRTVGDVVFVGTVGEEGLGDLRGVKALFRDRKDIDGFISVDGVNGEKGKYGVTGHATGSHRWEVDFKGPGGHSFGAFGAPSAIQAMGRSIAHISDVRTPAEPRTTFTVGVVAGGTSVNTIAAEASMLVDIRSNGGPELLATEKLIMAAIQLGVAEENARWSSTGIRAEPKLVGDRPAGQQPVATAPVIQAALQAHKALGLAMPAVGASSTDSNVPISLGIPSATLNGGGIGGGAHSPSEWYEPVEAWLGPQTVMLTTLALVGVEGAAKPQLPTRAR
jgi:acetylornithine deacetylase/succinyl-diaminopimelate desuccinylase-like protein